MTNRSSYIFPFAAALTLAAVSLNGCGESKKLSELQRTGLTAQIVLSKENDLPELKYQAARRDTITVKDSEGNSMFLMKAIKDEDTGDMVASEVIDAAVVTARFRNIAERKGKVDLRFQVIVPAEMQDTDWQLRFYPDMFILGDSLRLDPVIITGSRYRKAQLRGYEHYYRFLASIETDSTRFVDYRQLERFLQREIPDIYYYKNDYSEVSDEVFYSHFGTTEQEALEHFTNKMKKRRNARRLASKDRMYQKYIKSPIAAEGVRLDTVIDEPSGSVIYNYVQTINTRPHLKKADIVLSGEIYDRDRRIYTIPRTEPLTFYISSLSSFADETEHYVTRVIERKAKADVSYRIEFAAGKSDVQLQRGDNVQQIGYVKDNLMDILQNEVFDLDSIVVIANSSPEGSWSANSALSRRRGQAVVRYFEDFVKEYRRSVSADAGYSIDEDGHVRRNTVSVPDIRFISRSVPENWEMLDRLVKDDSRLSDEQRAMYFSLSGVSDKDVRESRMKGDDYYHLLREEFYPRLRVVDFAFHLHRHGMVKDTIRTTERDERYFEGLQKLKDMKYEEAAAILGPYQDYNAAVAFMGCERNVSAMLVLQGLEERTPQVNYLMAILYSRTGNEEAAVQCYLNACREEPSYIHRGNLDPEISALIKLYGLNFDN